jgi:hypothetical protein
MVALAAILLFGAITWWALEGQEVVLLRTRMSEGAVRETRVWIADEDGCAWLEAATAERAWYAELIANPRVEVLRDGEIRIYRAVPEPGPEGHARIRRLLAQKYGLADRWVGLVQDTSGSIAIRLEPE